MKNCFFVLFIPFLLSCATVDVERKARDSVAGARDAPRTGDTRRIVIGDPEVVVVERPVFVPEKEPPPRVPAAGEAAVRASNGAGIVRPSDYSHAAMIYDYNPDMVYEIYAQPLRVCDISLQPGERAVEAPFVSDSERWMLGGGVSYEDGAAVQHIYLKPQQAGLEASLIINTDRRVYRLILRSYSTVHMPLIRWRYFPPAPVFSFSGGGDGVPSGGGVPSGIDPRFISFNYRMTYPAFRKPSWLPELVFDDGGKTYVLFPDTVLQMELPAVYENRGDIVNYRVVGNLIVIDRLIENITVKIGRVEVSVSKKRGGKPSGNRN